MDVELRRSVRTIVRAGPDAIRSAIHDLEAELKAYKLSCPAFLAHSSARELLHQQARIEGDFLQCTSCGELVGSSVFYCGCQPKPVSHHGMYMIGDRDFMRSRCLKCHGIVGGPESSLMFPELLP